MKCISGGFNQERVPHGDIKILKVKGAKNLADSLTKYVTSEGLAMHMKGVSQEFKEDRHELMPEVSS